MYLQIHYNPFIKNAQVVALSHNFSKQAPIAPTTVGNASESGAFSIE
jgi:hypothetical protein